MKLTLADSTKLETNRAHPDYAGGYVMVIETGELLRLENEVRGSGPKHFCFLRWDSLPTEHVELDRQDLKISCRSISREEYFANHLDRPHGLEDFEVEEVAIEEIEVGDGRRRLNEKRVASLAQSLQEVGLQQPIIISRDLSSIRTVGDGEEFCEQTLIAGLHRLRAAERLGWGSITAKVYEDIDQTTAELIEITENFHRASLSEIEECEHMARWKQLLERRGCLKRATPGGQQGIGADREIAEHTSKSRATVQRKRAVAERLAPEVKEALKNPGDNAALREAADSGKQLAALARLNHEEQVQAAERTEQGETIPEAIAFIKGEPEEDPIEAQVDHIKSVYLGKPAEAQERFLNWANHRVAKESGGVS